MQSKAAAAPSSASQAGPALRSQHRSQYQCKQQRRRADLPLSQTCTSSPVLQLQQVGEWLALGHSSCCSRSQLRAGRAQVVQQSE